MRLGRAASARMCREGAATRLHRPLQPAPQSRRYADGVRRAVTATADPKWVRRGSTRSLGPSPPLLAAAVFSRYVPADEHHLTLADFARLVRETGVGGGNVADAQIQQLFEHVDKDSNGVIDVDEFKSWWPSVSQSYGGAESPLAAYDVLVQSDELSDDPRQRRALQELQRIWHDLKDRSEGSVPAEPKAPEGGFLTRFFGGSAPPPEPEVKPITGLYLYGGVGCGKSMVMDLFFEKATVKRKRRVHFHSFMLEIHSRIHALKRQDTNKGVPEVVEDIAKETELLCFDEFQVTDVGDAMILRRLFSALFQKGLVVVATSNRAPDQLYENGINRESFVPFIPLLKKNCTVHKMEDGTDYRRVGEKVTENTVYFTPLNSQSSKSLWRLMKHLTRHEMKAETVRVLGREVECRGAADGVCHFDFNELCKEALGPADFGAIARQYHTVCISGIPQMDLNQRTEARRFITLIDELYEKKCKLLCTAAAPPDGVFGGGTNGMESMLGFGTADLEMSDALKVQDRAASSLFSGSDEIFAMGRTVSRLNEMQTKDYLLEKHHFLDVPDYIFEWASQLDLHKE
eukprot:TRINITY_DN46934_c0_g1_i1.p1 TRINITY_DN46934_c0_g1~~TRINITY_DN46934_c0_g1_i1.p1  ORF type:complete len:574 (+),score=190.68 TRINITY_DN46934_c0_g1_i1:84-1805(+)